MGETPENATSREEALEGLLKEALDTLINLKNGGTWDEHVRDVDAMVDEACELGVEVLA